MTRRWPTVFVLTLFSWYLSPPFDNRLVGFILATLHVLGSSERSCVHARVQKSRAYPTLLLYRRLFAVVLPFQGIHRIGSTNFAWRALVETPRRPRFACCRGCSLDPRANNQGRKFTSPNPAVLTCWQSMGPRHGHMNHGYMNNMGMQAPPPDGSPLGQVRQRAD